MEQTSPLPNTTAPSQTATTPPANPPSSKKPLLIILLIIFVIILISLNAYLFLKLQNQSKIPAASPTPVVQASPTPAPDPTANWKTYNDTTYKFTLKLPQDWNVISALVEPKPKDIYVAYNSDTVDAYIERNPAQMNQSDLNRIIINSIPVVRIKNNIDTYRREYAILPLTNGTLILGATLSLDSSEAVIFDQILSTFKFLYQKAAGSGSCIPKFPVETGPELTASANYAQDCYNKTSESECLKVDIFRASTNNFGNSDGIPDCQWNAN